ncbi:MAG TPA: thiamine diphosphokinase [Acholeplasma sp.]|nr:thiamine diphosphokinase [Acholeplasma sp.]
MRVLVFSSEVPTINEVINVKEDDFIIAVDGAFDQLLKQKINIDLVIGDMDSVINKKRLKDYEKIVLNPKKDESDTRFAVRHAYTLSNNVLLIGGIKGDRIEHFIANLYILNEFNNLIIIDENSKIHLVKEGKHLISKGKYINIYAFPECVISLKGFIYELNNYHLKQYDSLILSNEVKNIYGEVIIEDGKAIIIETKKGH